MLIYVNKILYFKEQIIIVIIIHKLKKKEKTNNKLTNGMFIFRTP